MVSEDTLQRDPLGVDAGRGLGRAGVLWLQRYRSTTGRTSTEPPKRAAGIRPASSIA
jgi:hypothetical protein